MKRPKMPKFPRVSLMVVLWSIFGFAVLIEALILYKYLYLNSQNLPELPITPTVQIDKKGTAEAKSWLEGNEDYEAPNYESQKSADVGRENPFAEY